VALAAAAAGVLDPGPALGWERAVYKGQVEPADLSRVRALTAVRDVVISTRDVRASQSAPIRVEKFTDRDGLSITVGTPLPVLDLRPIASVLAGSVHGGELETVRVWVVFKRDVGGACGTGPEVAACYIADTHGGRSGSIVVGYDDPDRTHTLVHEYGHHVDNQLFNLAQLGQCTMSSDGSRRWFFARDSRDGIRRRAGCTTTFPHDRRIGEVFAEDYVALNQIRDWFLRTFPPPTDAVLGAMRRDIRRPFVPRVRRYRGRLVRHGRRTHRLRLDAPTYLGARLRGPGRGRSDFDLALYRRGGRRAFARGVRSGPDEVVVRFLRRGNYELRVSGRGSGSYSLVVALF
jgi:hypothetical protein